ncbi:MAG: deoxyribodipyrimidine photo-lyase [Bacteroidales bacterium]|nr:deoxyribodipyrimidine photo-lyase [Bacteroidales bacterium]
MDITESIAVFWFRRDLRLFDNTALFKALTSGFKVFPVFIFDRNILQNLNPDDKRVSFIYQAIQHLNEILLPYKTSIQVYFGTPDDVFEQLLSTYDINRVYTNHDYEPYAMERDLQIKKKLAEKGVLFHTFKDQVIFEKDEITKLSGEPYTVYTPYSHKWIEKLNQDYNYLHNWNSENYLFNFLPTEKKMKVSFSEMGFNETKDVFQSFQLNQNSIWVYDKTRDFPALDSTSKVSVHLRFGTVSIRQLVAQALEINSTWLGELIWREFFMQILWHFPHVVHQPFKPKYQFIQWVNNEKNFESWCKGQTGYPLVDAGMRELNQTGFMHNRVRMVTASFLVKHLLISWQWGEAYFAGKLLDFELASNNGNWQWAAGTGCDAAPYFRIFNPVTQAEKFDPLSVYIKKWIPEYNTKSYIQPMLDHAFARERCLETYKASL